MTSTAKLSKQYRELAETIAAQAQAIADGTHTAGQYGQVARLMENVETLRAWTPDDRSA